MREKRLKNRKFKKRILLYSIVMVALCIIFNVYIFFTLVSFEKNQTNNVLKDAVRKIDDKTLTSYLKDNNLSEDLLDDYKKLVKSDDIEFVKSEGEIFNVVINGRILFTIETKVIAEKTKLAFFSYQEREIIKIEPELERGFIYYDVVVPSNFTIYADGEKIEGKNVKEENYKNLDFMYYNDSMPKMVTYQLNNLDSEKKITVKDFYGNDVDLKENNNKYFVDEYYLSVDTLDKLKEKLTNVLDISDVAHKWSLFMTKDLSGSRYGFYTMAKYLIEGTSQYEMAYSWATGIDITFTSRHTLKNPTFTDESINNFKIYSDSAFSCEITLTKNMVVNGKDQPDKMHDVLYFIKDNSGSWKLMSIQSVGDVDE